uniref:Uncharacterized protein n=1 Tax=Octopus bimaculoides TaxID=37653 RepID=A0A0L8GHQ9_OCTBM
MTSFLCDHVEVVELPTNLRLLPEGHSDEREFANYLLGVGNGNISVEQSLDFVYTDLKYNFTNSVWFANRTIVTPINEAAQFVNDFLLNRIPGELKIYGILDTIDNETLYPIEFTNKLTPSGFPLHIFKRKEK